MERRVPIDAIKVDGRYRKDLGDIDSLAESIKTIGLIQPVVVNKDNVLIAGHRRMEACRKIGWSEIDVVVAEHIVEAVDLLMAERDENTCRKPMTASELIELGKAIEEMEHPKAKANQGTRTDLGKELLVRPYEKFDSREKAAEAVDMSTATYSRIKQVYDAAHDPELPEDERDRAAASMELIDRIKGGEEIRPESGGRPLTISSVYEEWKGQKINRKDEAPPEARRQPAIVEDPGGMRRPPKRRQWDLITSGVSALKGLGHGFRAVKELDPDITREEATQLEKELAESLRVLRTFHKKVKEFLDAGQS